MHACMAPATRMMGMHACVDACCSLPQKQSEQLANELRRFLMSCIERLRIATRLLGGMYDASSSHHGMRLVSGLLCALACCMAHISNFRGDGTTSELLEQSCEREIGFVGRK